MPSKNYGKYLNSTDRKFFDRVITNADEVTAITDLLALTSPLKRMNKMVDESDLLIALWDGKNEGAVWQTVTYARANNKEVLHVPLNSEGFKELF